MKTVIEVAREAGAIHIHKSPKEFALVGNEAIERFAQLVLLEHWSKQTTVSDIGDAVAAEREACAKVCDSRAAKYDGFSAEQNTAEKLAEAIRSRGKSEG